MKTKTLFFVASTMTEVLTKVNNFIEQTEDIQDVRLVNVLCVNHSSIVQPMFYAVVQRTFIGEKTTDDCKI